MYVIVNVKTAMLQIFGMVLTLIKVTFRMCFNHRLMLMWYELLNSSNYLS
jgi:hypothetical protein